MGLLFSNSQKAISENLSTEELAAFTTEVTELNTRLDTQASANALVVADLASANTQITELTASLATAQANATALNAQIVTLTSERDKFKTQHEKSASKGDQNPDEDENSRKQVQMSSYNQHAMSVWEKANAK